MTDEHDERARNLAVEIVDMVHGYTVEHASNPTEHRIEYDVAYAGIITDLRELEAETIERCAKVADQWSEPARWRSAMQSVAAAIRALKEDGK